MENYSEKKTIKLSMVVLFLSLMIIYILFYHMKGKEIELAYEQKNEENITSLTTREPQIVEVNRNQNTGTENTSYETNTNTYIDNYNGNNTGNIKSGGDQFSEEFYQRYENQKKETGSNDLENRNNNINMENIDSQITIIEEDRNEEKNDIVNLSGTDFYHGPIEGIEKLGISYPYALKDKKDIYYIYLGDNDYDFADIVRQLNGYLYILNTEQELLEHKLFGDKITYINIPEYRDNLVLMIIELDGQKWLVQVSYAIYHESKNHIKSVFMQN